MGAAGCQCLPVGQGLTPRPLSRSATTQVGAVGGIYNELRKKRINPGKLAGILACFAGMLVAITISLFREVSLARLAEKIGFHFQQQWSAMSHPISAPKLPKGLSFELPDHDLASEWAKSNAFHLIIDLNHGVEGEEYEEILAFHIGGRLRFVMWRQVDCFVVHPLVGRARQFHSMNAALTALTPAAR